MDTIIRNYHFIEDIINGMYDWVRVIDRDDNMIFVNKAMIDNLGWNPTGEKCYRAVGKNSPCENCVSRKSTFDGVTCEKEEIIDGKTFSVMSSPVKNENGKIVAVVEVLRDVTRMKLLQQKVIEQNDKFQYELNIAKKLQNSLLPKRISDERIDFAFVYKPCETLGGDFLDIFNIDGNHIGIYIADVSGHGASASMLTIFLRASLNKKSLSPAKALNELYMEFNRNGFDHDLYITIFYAVIDLGNKRIIYSNAGHSAPPVVLSSEALAILRVPGIPISNWLDKPHYVDRSRDLHKGDRIFLYTDGITDVRNSENRQFGEERLVNMLLNSSLKPSTILDGIIEAAAEFSGPKKPFNIHDDVTMALLEIK